MRIDARASNPSSLIFQNSGVLQLFLMLLCGTHRYMKGNSWAASNNLDCLVPVYCFVHNSIVCRDFLCHSFLFFFYSFSKTVCKLCLQIDFAVSIVDHGISILVFCMGLWVLVYYRLSFLLKDDCIHFHPTYPAPFLNISHFLWCGVNSSL